MRNFIRFSLFLMSVLVVGPAISKEMGFDIIQHNASVIVVADGEITADTPKVFQEFLSRTFLDGSFRFMALNSRGGNLAGGMTLGRLIRKSGLITNVNSYPPRRNGEEHWAPLGNPGICASACALAFIGGRDRMLNAKSILGFHQFSSSSKDANEMASVSKTEATTQLISSLVHDYIVTMGVSAALFSAMSSALPNEMYVPNPQELRQLNIIQPTAFSDFVLEPYGDGIIAYSIFPGNVKGSNIVSQITAYCRKGNPYILLSQPKQFEPRDNKWLKMIGEAVTGFNLWDNSDRSSVKYPRSNVSLRIGGQPLAEIRIDQKGIDILMREAKGNVSGLVSALGTFMSFTVRPTEADKKMLRSAFRLCVG